MLMEAIKLCSTFKMYHLMSEPFNHARNFFLANKHKSIFVLTKKRNKHTFCFTQLLEYILILSLEIHQTSVKLFPQTRWLPDLNTTPVYLETTNETNRTFNIFYVKLLWGKLFQEGSEAKPISGIQKINKDFNKGCGILPYRFTIVDSKNWQQILRGLGTHHVCPLLRIS